MRTNLNKATYTVIVLAAITLIGGAFYLDKLELKDIGTGLLALLGTLLGATLAFRLNEDKESKKEQAVRRSALNRALFILARQKNAVALIAREMEPFKTPIERAFNFPAAKVPPYQDLVHRFEELEFLLNTPDVNVIMRLTVEQERFHQMLESLRTRNEFYVHELQPEIARHSLNGKEISGASIVQLFGERLFGTAMHSSEILRHHVESSLKSIPEMHEELRAVAKRLYPDSKFVGFASED
ncbi:MAG: hypothetical protein Q7R66_20470 [Undibacterium sp.]|uniref:hypothetical protein n=1 Tax=Undibacterium sp. TaxID=1914977 RepID=UPI0027210802|nr:hypothetical protein [Undibacterium sp.]MDO8654553.1 hypothetical protein [Undibacterium sp.]